MLREGTLDPLGDHFLHAPQLVVAETELLQVLHSQVDVLGHGADGTDCLRERVCDGIFGKIARVFDAPSGVREGKGTHRALGCDNSQPSRREGRLLPQ